MGFPDELRQFISRHFGGRLAQLMVDPLFLIGAAGLIVLLIVLIVLAAS